MSFRDANRCLEKVLDDGWLSTPKKWQNVPFDPPKDSNGNAEPYVAFAVFENEGINITLGSDNPWYRWTGLAIISVFVPENTGPDLARQYADTIKALFLMKSLSLTPGAVGTTGIVRTRVPRITQANDTDHGFYQVNVSVPYNREAHT